MIVSIDPITYANTPHATSMLIIPYIFSFTVLGEISPYPTVVMVTKAQYRDVIYLCSKGRS